MRRAFPSATIIRPAAMFGPDDAFLMPLTALLRRFPVIPLFGSGQTRLQPAYVEDVGAAIARSFDAASVDSVYELGGPCIYTYRELLQALADRLGLRRALIPVPFAAWHALALLAELLPHPPITRSQVELMRVANVASPACAGFAALGLAPQGLEAVLPVRHR